MKWFLLALLCLQLSEGLVRVKLKKAKSIREKMREAGVLEEYLKKVKPEPGQKYKTTENNVVLEPITSHMDVSSPGSPLPSPPLSLLLPNCQSHPEPPGVRDFYFPLYLFLFHLFSTLEKFCPLPNPRPSYEKWTFGALALATPSACPGSPFSFQIQSIRVTSQEFGLSENEPTQPFYYAEFDGILGMAYPSLAVGGTPTPLQNMLQQNQLSEPIFSFYFSRQPTYEYGGELVLGGIDPQFFRGDIVWAPVTQELYWQVPVDGFAIGQSPTGWCRQGCQAIVDTGTSLLTVPQEYMESFLQAVGAQLTSYGYAVDCNNVQNLPTITFIISGVPLPLYPSTYILNVCYCTVGIEATYLPSQNGQPLWIFGDVFLREYYTIFDMANNQVGFAPSV
ncbi:PEPC protein, partial [Oreotrochilus melanogaster]|nr:PEPC protein [Oreotrochilus melanogaster]